MSTPTPPTMSELDRQRSELALAASEGRRGAASALASVERAIEAHRLAEERAQAADSARQARARVEVEAEETRRRAATESQLLTLESRRLELASVVDRAAAGLASAVRDLRACGDEIYTLSGANRPRARAGSAVVGSLTWRLAEVAPEFGRSDKFYRRSIHAILSGEEGPPPDAPPSRPAS
jgi:hypothetical protein